MKNRMLVGALAFSLNFIIAMEHNEKFDAKKYIERYTGKETNKELWKEVNNMSDSNSLDNLTLWTNTHRLTTFDSLQLPHSMHIPQVYCLHECIKKCDLDGVKILIAHFGNRIIAEFGHGSDTLPFAYDYYKQNKGTEKAKISYQIIELLRNNGARMLIGNDDPTSPVHYVETDRLPEEMNETEKDQFEQYFKT